MLVQETTVQTSQPGFLESPATAEVRRTEARAPAKTRVEEPRDAAKADASQTNDPEVQQQSERSSRARLSLDPELHRVFVEIVDPKTGDVITRFPPEQLTDHIDSVLEQTDQTTNLEDSGLIVDESV